MRDEKVGKSKGRVMQIWYLKRMSASCMAILLMASSLVIVGCSSDEDEDDGNERIVLPRTIDINAANVRRNVTRVASQVLDGLSFSMDAAAFSPGNIAGTIDVSFSDISGDGSEGDFVINGETSGGLPLSARGTVFFAIVIPPATTSTPCRFEVSRRSDFPLGSGLGPRESINFTTCRIAVGASDAPAARRLLRNSCNGASHPTEVDGTIQLVLTNPTSGTTLTSTVTSVPVSIDDEGNICVNGLDSDLDVAL